ncbi:MAG: hypothetical protein HY064_06525 [Bacteroidetes bacterium]|nr:hypothetical protein [Bacteroidota bacterium]
MTAKELKRIFQKGECLSLDTMKLYSDGKLHKKSMHEVEKHLIECGLCSAAMDGLNSKRLAEVNKLSSHIQRRLAVYMNTPPRISFFRRFGMMMGAGILLIGGCFTVLHLSGYNPFKSKQPAATALKNSVATINSGATRNSVNSNSVPDNNSSTVASSSGNSGSTLANQKNSSSKVYSVSSLQDLPATQPGVQNTLTVKQENDSHQDEISDMSNGSNSRTANNNSPLRIKSILVYPPITHDDGKSTRKESHDGQLGRSDGGNASFKLEDMPSFPGGDEALKSYIRSNFKSISVDRSKLTRYATGITITVNSKTGEVSVPDLSYSISPDIDAEIIRVFRNMPNWNPGKKKGLVDVMIGVTFE